MERSQFGVACQNFLFFFFPFSLFFIGGGPSSLIKLGIYSARLWFKRPPLSPLQILLDGTKRVKKGDNGGDTGASEQVRGTAVKPIRCGESREPVSELYPPR